MGRAAPGDGGDGHANDQNGADRVRGRAGHANVRNASARDRPRPPPATPGGARWGRHSSCLKIEGDVVAAVSGGDMIYGQPVEDGDDDDEE